MSRRTAALVLAGVLASTAAPTNAADAIPPVAFPTIPDQARSASDLVPGGWIVETEVRGDLNRDGVPDLVLVLRMNDPQNVIADDDREASRLDTNPRLLVVALVDERTHALSPTLLDHTLIPRHTDPRMEDPLLDVAVVRGTLQASLGVLISAGGWTTSHRKFTFRHRNGCFQLIGYDATEMQRNTGKLSEVSVNHLTKKVKRSWGYSGDAMNESWTTMAGADLLCVEDVGDGLEFDPGLEPDTGRAAELLKAATDAEPRWSTTIDSLQLGSGDRSATFRDVRSTCNPIQLAGVLGSTAGELHDCLEPTTTVRVTVAFADGQLASRIDPDDEESDCVTMALDRAHFDDLTCRFVASVSSP